MVSNNIEKTESSVDFQLEILSCYFRNKEKEELDLVIVESDLKNFLISNFAIDQHQIESISYSGNQLNVKLKKG